MATYVGWETDRPMVVRVDPHCYRGSAACRTDSDVLCRKSQSEELSMSPRRVGISEEEWMNEEDVGPPSHVSVVAEANPRHTSSTKSRGYMGHRCTY